ncbi:hypothetical protein E2C01_010253 [Portunus trituberculatus]|uniref:Uncharacterized protein n=1 Tax=Portunus trituberculatus TaxID=210409 RepID=A0A5B7D7W6_PORTR|nr:hypothetical protein [Portunus trituberculatus]
MPQIFSLSAGLRVIQLMMKAMSLLYVVFSLQCWRGGCLSLLVITALPLGETTGLLYHICRGDRLLQAVTAAAYQVPAGSDDQVALAHIASRMESCLPRVLAWGFHSLTLETFIQLSRMVTACLVIVVQLGEDDHLAHAYTDGPLTRYDHCFTTNTTTITIANLIT